ncbi:hypothetical protein GCM10011335_45840 [Aureimonas glaciei]|uniref:Uncharacterized protein n=1 Tax=Aureimonas glaciei TaxID=1776957 RepID=A0A917DI97_9HYPH|nr:hypothetical protein GCM10011335_45840 [Aureimonas glaciei]
MVDTRYDDSAQKMIDDLGKGEIDAAILWGPQAGYYARESKKDYVVTPLVKETKGPSMAFRITVMLHTRLLGSLLPGSQVQTAGPAGTPSWPYGQSDA